MMKGIEWQLVIDEEIEEGYKVGGKLYDMVEKGIRLVLNCPNVDCAIVLSETGKVKLLVDEFDLEDNEVIFLKLNHLIFDYKDVYPYSLDDYFEHWSENMVLTLQDVKDYKDVKEYCGYNRHNLYNHIERQYINDCRQYYIEHYLDEEVNRLTSDGLDRLLGKEKAVVMS